MQLIKVFLCCCCVFSGHFSNGSSIHSSEIKSHLINHTMELIDKGFANNSNPLIISSDLVDDQMASGNVDSGKPLIVINSDQKRKQIEGYLPSHPTYILRYESLPKLTSLIFGFMRSSTCNIKSPIFLLDVSEGTHDTNASIALGFLASLDILISYYVSYDDKKDSTMVYTLNPYTQYAPSPWNQEITFKKYFVYWTKKNWALKDKIDKVRSIPVETGLFYHYNEEIIKNLWKRKEKMEKIKENENYERVDFDNLVFYFIMFAATLLWSLVIFGIEFMVYHIHSKYLRREKERRQFIERLRTQPRIILPQVE
ncbi:Protein of unknown function [Cotesia congregata]|uniref:Uncharacterized protein n=1 Tax=Cotesia congregata TaxID=51543 RepID=A0A8J2EC22_COTCN|nr:Protein of unknown function [Cotesia congregata]